jgi:hypothetical protein
VRYFLNSWHFFSAFGVLFHVLAHFWSNFSTFGLLS